MPKPPQQPLQKPKIKNTTDELAPTAASESMPRNRPTMAASTNEYVCCNKLPISKGKVK